MSRMEEAYIRIFSIPDNERDLSSEGIEDCVSKNLYKYIFRTEETKKESEKLQEQILIH